MNWTDFFNDLQKWMEASNEISKKHPITTDEYWGWLVKTIGIIGDRYNNHPLVLNFLTALIQFQDDNFKTITGRK
ncbi:hypothetical protein [Enterococcus sp. AZ103]|uniref:hypothetical protein n=1 Tax=Enterococcus sp. AZ103 TaxID=2774628 RepID=UPI003F2368C7